MAIEFRCTQCGNLLRTGDETAGKQAKCPTCGALTTIPGPADMGESQVPPLAPLGLEISASPVPSPGSPFGPGQVLPGQAHPFAARRVSGPATALIVTAILSIVGQVLGILVNLVQMAVPRELAAGRPQMVPGHEPELFPQMLGGISVALGVFGLAMAVLILIGALKMKRLESYSFALTAAIIAMIPCISPCCLLGLPFGIWALVVLGDSSVKAAFRS